MKDVEKTTNQIKRNEHVKTTTLFLYRHSNKEIKVKIEIENKINIENKIEIVPNASVFVTLGQKVSTCVFPCGDVKI